MELISLRLALLKIWLIYSSFQGTQSDRLIQCCSAQVHSTGPQYCVAQALWRGQVGVWFQTKSFLHRNNRFGENKTKMMVAVDASLSELFL